MSPTTTSAGHVNRPHRPRTMLAASVTLILAVLAAMLPATGSDVARAAGTTGPGTTSGEDSTCVTGTGHVVVEEPWPQERLGLPALGQQYRGWGITIAVLSSGVSGDHPQLRGRVLDGINIGSAGPANTDCLGFGTAIAGAAAAAPVSGTSLVGVASQASILPVRLPDWVVNPPSQLDNGHRVQASHLLAQTITAALQRAPQVMVLPSTSLPDSTQLRAAIATAEERGCLLIEGAPATADRRNAYPAGYPEVLVVAGDSREGDEVPTALADDQIDLIAPGLQVPVLTPGTGHRLVTSTTVSAGLTAGAGALVLEAARPRSAAEARTRLRRSTVPSVHGRIPVLDPATALSSSATTVQQTRPGPLGRLLAGKTAPERASIAGVAVAAGILAALGLVLFAGTAVYRGRRRRWRPAGRSATRAAGPAGLPLTDDPFRPLGRSEAWWLAGNPGDTGLLPSASTFTSHRSPGAPSTDPADASASGDHS